MARAGATAAATAHCDTLLQQHTATTHCNKTWGYEVARVGATSAATGGMCSTLVGAGVVALVLGGLVFTRIVEHI